MADRQHWRALHPMHPLFSHAGPNQSLCLCYILHFHGLAFQKPGALLLPRGVFWSILESALTYKRCGTEGRFFRLLLQRSCIWRNGTVTMGRQHSYRLKYHPEILSQKVGERVTEHLYIVVLFSTGPPYMWSFRQQNNNCLQSNTCETHLWV